MTQLNWSKNLITLKSGFERKYVVYLQKIYVKASEVINVQRVIYHTFPTVNVRLGILGFTILWLLRIGFSL